jgi:hypothetical protein
MISRMPDKSASEAELVVAIESRPAVIVVAAFRIAWRCWRPNSSHSVFQPWQAQLVKSFDVAGRLRLGPRISRTALLR